MCTFLSFGQLVHLLQSTRKVDEVQDADEAVAIKVQDLQSRGGVADTHGVVYNAHVGINYQGYVCGHKEYEVYLSLLRTRPSLHTRFCLNRT